MKTDEEIDEGFDYIAANAPLSMTDNAHLKWIEKQKNNMASPIYDCKESLVEKAINNLMNDRALAPIGSLTIPSPLGICQTGRCASRWRHVSETFAPP
eukprot:4543345-Amphidinium_carterae.1